MAERFCLRCDWSGETDESACPRCGAPLYRLESEPAPAEPSAGLPPTETPTDAPSTRLETPHEEEVRDEEVLSPVSSGERGRWRVIALALTLTAVVAFALTRGGDPERAEGPGGRSRAAAAPSPSAPNAATSATFVSTCSGNPATPDLSDRAESVPGATADYLFQDSLESSIGSAPDLTEIEEGSSVFTVDARSGTTVLRFAGSRGLALAPMTGLVRDDAYTIELLFRFDFVSKYRKVVDFRNGSADGGLYVLDGCLTFFPKELDARTSIAPNAFVQVVLTRDEDGRVVAYVNGVRQFAFADRGGLATLGRPDTIRFFADDHTTTGEYSSGAVSQIRLFDEPLTESEVAALACSEIAIADATASCRD